jgi:hypothetical protein
MEGVTCMRQNRFPVIDGDGQAGAAWKAFMMDRLDEDFERRGKKWAPRL